MIVAEGHEVGHHTYSHRWAGDSFDQEVEEMEKGLEALKRTVGVVPKGYRSPAGEVGEGLFGLLNKHGFLYDTSLLDHINPYRHVMPDGSKGPIELPWHWSLDDAPLHCFRSRIRGRFSPTNISPASSRTSFARFTAGVGCST